MNEVNKEQIFVHMMFDNPSTWL